MKPIYLMLGKLVLVLLIAFGPISLASVQGAEVEPNNTCLTAQNLGAVTLPFSLDGSLDTPPSIPDVDFFKFTGTPGARVKVDLKGSDTGNGTLSDPLIGLFDSGCNQISDEDDSGVGFNSRLLFTIPANGVFILAASSFDDFDFDGDGGSNGTYRLTIGPTATRFSGTAIGVGRGANKGGIRIVGRLTLDGAIDLSDPSATVRINRLFDEVGGAGEVVDSLPLFLDADCCNNASTAIYKTAAGQLPIAKMTLGRRGQNEFTFRLEVSKATIAVPSQCPTTNLTMSFTIDDDGNPPAEAEVASVQPWRCFGTGNQFLRTP